MFSTCFCFFWTLCPQTFVCDIFCQRHVRSFFFLYRRNMFDTFPQLTHFLDSSFLFFAHFDTFHFTFFTHLTPPDLFIHNFGHSFTCTCKLANFKIYTLTDACTFTDTLTFTQKRSSSTFTCSFTFAHIHLRVHLHLHLLVHFPLTHRHDNVHDHVDFSF